MSKDKFNKFLEEKKDAQENKFDPSKEKKQWIENIDSFYSQIKQFLAEYIENKRVTVTHEQISIYEEQLGTYQVDKMTLHAGGKVVFFNPIGTFLIGSKGRIDMKGPLGVTLFGLVAKGATRPNIKVRINPTPEELKQDEEEHNKPIEWEWRIISRRDMKYIKLTEESFFTAFMEVLGD